MSNPKPDFLGVHEDIGFVGFMETGFPSFYHYYIPRLWNPGNPNVHEFGRKLHYFIDSFLSVWEGEANNGQMKGDDWWSKHCRSVYGTAINIDIPLIFESLQKEKVAEIYLLANNATLYFGRFGDEVAVAINDTHRTGKRALGSMFKKGILQQYVQRIGANIYIRLDVNKCLDWREVTVRLETYLPRVYFDFVKFNLVNAYIEETQVAVGRVGEHSIHFKLFHDCEISATATDMGKWREKNISHQAHQLYKFESSKKLCLQVSVVDPNYSQQEMIEVIKVNSATMRLGEYLLSALYAMCCHNHLNASI